MAYSRYTTYATSTTGEQPSVNLDPSINPFLVTVAVWVVGGSASFGLEWSFDDFATVSDSNARWFADKFIPVGSTASTFVGYTTPATRVRLNIASNSGGIEFKILQGLSIN
jgi:hypothetical protein